MDWDKLRTFYTVAKIGTFTGAGEALNLSQSAISRQIAGLEASLGITLFHRHARGLILTEQGDILYQTVQDVFTKLTLTEAMLSENTAKPVGPLKITAAPSFASSWLSKNLNLFIKKYPDINLHLLVEHADLDLRTREADVAIRMHEAVQFDLIQRHLTNFPLQAFASEGYIKQFGHPKNLKEMKNHRLISTGQTPVAPFQQANWIVQRYAKYEQGHLLPFLTINNFIGMKRLIQADVGIGVLPSYISDDVENLIPVLDNVEVPTLPAYYVYPVELRSSKKVRAFRDFLMENLVKNS